MKHRDLVKRINEAAKAKELLWALIKQSAEHEKWSLGTQPVMIPRHREINEITALSIMKSLEEQLGKGWWK